jgi:hypothetical protein
MHDMCGNFGFILLIAAFVYAGVKWGWFNGIAQYWLSKQEEKK